MGALQHKKRVSLEGDMNVLLADNHGVPRGGGAAGDTLSWMWKLPKYNVRI